MRAPKPYYKKSHHAWYANIGPNGRPVRLASEEEGEAKAYERYYQIMAGRQPVNSDGRVVDLLERFLDHHHENSAPATYQFYLHPINSFARHIGPKPRLVNLKPHHVYDWIDRNHRGGSSGRSWGFWPTAGEDGFGSRELQLPVRRSRASREWVPKLELENQRTRGLPRPMDR